MFKLAVIGLIIVGKDPFALFGMQAPGLWEWGQGNKVGLAGAAPRPGPRLLQNPGSCGPAGPVPGVHLCDLDSPV